MDMRLAMVVLLGLLSGCETLGRKFDPSIVEVVDDGDRKPVAASVATTAERRVVVIKLRADDTIGKFCAEPSPDAAESVAGSFSSALQLKGGTSHAPEAAASVGGSFGNAIASLSKRTQGLILYRDGMFALCQAHLNQAISPKEFLDRSTRLLEASEKLIALEITETSGRIGPRVVAAATPPPSAALAGAGIAGAFTGPGGASPAAPPPTDPSQESLATQAAKIAGSAAAVNAARQARPGLSNQDAAVISRTGAAVAADVARQEIQEAGSVTDAVKAGSKAAEKFGKETVGPTK
ncbi:hypothetical protein [Lysobacter sp. 22409]|uniref:hypothetical protein n=1 Tax=Lysobacter sp. 22409 TaxID=3453917 RepID=UPI003F87CE8D